MHGKLSTPSISIAMIMFLQLSVVDPHYYFLLNIPVFQELRKFVQCVEWEAHVSRQYVTV